MQKIKNITIVKSQNDPDFWEVQFPNGYYIGRTEHDLFHPDMATQLFANMRTAFLIGGYAYPQSKEFRDGINNVNGQDGFQTAIGKVYIRKIENSEEPGLLRIFFSKKKSEIIQDISINQYDLVTEPDEMTRCENVVNNIGIFLKLSGFTSITPEAIQAVQKQSFWW